MAYNTKMLSTILYILGVPVALLAGAAAGAGLVDISILAIPMVIVGIGIGVLNVKKAESVIFLLSVGILAVGSAGLSLLPFVGTIVQGAFSELALVMVPAALVLAAVKIWSVAK